ncbi:hypothetical protein NPIL_533401, partial [Nephila pilipes]
PSSAEIISYTTEILDSIWPATTLIDDSENEDVENVVQEDECTLEENNYQGVAENEPLTQENEVGDEMEEEFAEVLEYTPVASTLEIISSSSRLDYSWKRKADSPAGGENTKRRRLILVECPVCLDAVPDMEKIGKVLMVAVCGHVMCSNCAMRIWIQRRNRCRCPKCHKKYKIDTLQPVYL